MGATDEEEVVAGHAVAVVEAKGKLWCWAINFGWSAMTVPLAKRDDVATVAEPLTARYAAISPKSPLYRFDFPQARRRRRSPVARVRTARRRRLRRNYHGTAR